MKLLGEFNSVDNPKGVNWRYDERTYNIPVHRVGGNQTYEYYTIYVI